MVWVVVAAGAMCAVAALRLPGGAARPEMASFPVLACVAALAVAAGIAYAGRRGGVGVWTVVGVLVAGAAGWSGYLAWVDHASGVPGSASAVLAVASVGVGLGVLGCLVVRRSGGVVSGVVAGVVAGVVVGAAVAAGFVAPGLPVRAGTAPRAAAPPVAEAPGEGAWTWRTDGLREVVAAGTGVVAASGRAEVTALDGRTGDIRWRYARTGALVRNLIATPDRALVLAAFAPSGPDARDTELLVTFDATTGVVLDERPVDGLDTDDGFLAVTNTVRPVRERGGEDRPTTAYDLRTGEARWTWTPPEGCTSPFMLAASTADAVMVTQRCPDGLSLLALDDRTGEPRWTHPAPSADSTFYPHSDADGRLLAVRANARPVTLLRVSDGSTVTTTDESVNPAAVPLLTTDMGEPTAVIDPGTGETTDLPQPACPDPVAATSTPSTLLYRCGDAVVTHGLPAGSPVSRPLPELPAVDHGTFANRPLSTRLLAAPGAVVVATAAESAVTGYPGK
ncbi:PQQ-binding-like beta-propeller repeat protein [Actinokineospora guangxiensis]|uniref:PQQ-binding-like beta-propeller repeat protein n=1 Tax=Actinokineospora guangxiensis TaxID=1490288 RepID=A0ABW0ETZ7_9PSEU